MIFRTVLVSALRGIGAGWMFEYEVSRGASPEDSRPATVNLFVTVAELGHIARSHVRCYHTRGGLRGVRWAGVVVLGEPT